MRNRLRIAVLFTALLAVGAACSDDKGGAVDVGSATGVTQSPITNVPLPPGGIPADLPPGAGERREVTPDLSVVNPTPSAIESYTQVDDDTVTLRFTMGVEDCYGLQKVDVSDQPDAVTVTLLVGGKPGAQVCVDLAELVQTTVDLPSALGDRPIIDGSTGEQVHVPVD